MEYDRTTWVPGVTEFTSARANNIELGLVNARNAIAGLQSIRARTVSAYEYGVRADGTNRRTELLAALTAAESAGGGGCVELPSGTVRISGNLPLSGYSSGMVGSGSSATSGLSAQLGTLLEFVSQTGPAIDFTGFVYPHGQRGKVTFSDFAVKGDGAAGKKGILLDTGEGGSSGINLRDIIVYNTGGVGLHVKDHYLSEFSGVVVCNPVNSASSDIPWVLLEGANGNRYIGLGLRSLNFNDAVADVPPSGALRVIAGSLFQHHLSVFVAPWFENMHVGQDSAMVVTQSNKVTFSDPQFFDCYRVVGTTGTTHFRVEAPGSQNYGGNIFRGLIPGKGGGATNEIEAGIDLRQSSNHIHGVKGSGGNNVVLASGVGYTSAFLGGAENPGNNVGIADSSGVNTNTLIDMPQGTWIIGERSGAGFLRIAGAYQGDKVLDRGSITANTTFTTLLGQNIFTATLGANISITAITANSSQVGRRIVVSLTQDGTGSRTVTWPSNVKFAGATAPTLTTTAGRTDSFTFVYNGTNFMETSRSMNIG